MTLVLAKRHLGGGFLHERNSGLCEWRDRRIVFFFDGLLGVLEIRICERDPLIKRYRLEICGRPCSGRWLEKLKVMVASN